MRWYTPLLNSKATWYAFTFTLFIVFVFKDFFLFMSPTILTLLKQSLRRTLVLLQETQQLPFHRLKPLQGFGVKSGCCLPSNSYGDKLQLLCLQQLFNTVLLMHLSSKALTK